MTRTFRPLLLLCVMSAAVAAACVPTQTAVRGSGGRGTEAWSWRMGATEGRWTRDRSQNAVRAELGSQSPAPAAEPEEPAAAGEDEAEMTLEPDPVGPAKKPKAVTVASARPTAKKARVQPLHASDSDEEFLDKILNEKADAEGGEITMAAMELPKAKTPAKKKRMTRAERRKALRLARAEKKKAKQLAAREARLRGKRARIDEEEQTRAGAARKAKRNKKKGTFDENGEGFIDDDADGEAELDEVERKIASGYQDEDEEEDEADDDDEEAVAAPAKKKAKPAAAPAKAVARAAPAKKVKTDWSGQAVDDEDPLKASKKK